jgi:predicted nucleic acid-binding Zn ribbon protein
MPTYVYKFVDTGETIEVQQGFHEDNLTELAHPDTGEVLPVKKVFTPVGVTFKGSGFFKTDSRGTKGSGGSTSSSDTAASSGSSAGASSDSGGSSSAATSSGDSGSKPAAPSTPAAG